MSDGVTVYMPTRNRPELLRRAVESVFNQTSLPFELIVVDDSSEIPAFDVLERWRCPELTVIRFDTPQGACSARNAAIKRASYDYITGIDDDDFFSGPRLEEFYSNRTVLCEGVSCLFTDFQVQTKLGQSERFLPDIVDLSAIKTRNLLGCQVFTRTERLSSLGGFDIRMPAWQDFELWYRLILRYGSARKVGSASYTVDVSHDSPRISTKRSQQILLAFRLFERLHGDAYSPAELCALMANYIAYPGANDAWPEFAKRVFSSPAAMPDALRAIKARFI